MILAARSDVEERFIALGTLDGVPAAIVYTHRGRKIRLITARRMRTNERRAYQAYLAGRGDGAQR
ncbi:BrnT family toxin [Pseudooceanicola nanhaiensis]